MIYGINYMGSKSSIAEDIVNFLPSGNRFVDLFGGGFAISHCVLINHIYNKQLSLFGQKWKSLLYNDYDPLIVDVVTKAINGFYNYGNFKPKFINKKEFNKLKEKNGYIKTCWSFGGNGQDYLYSKEIAPYKKACHQAIVFDEWQLMKKLCPEVWQEAYKTINGIKDIKLRRLNFAPAIVKKLKQIGNWDVVIKNPLYKSCHWRGKKLNSTNNDLQCLQSLERLQRLQSLESLERLQSLQSLERLQSLEITCKSYEDFKYKDGDVVYCDIPYEGTHEYSGGFDHNKFYAWAYSRPYQVFFSSYDNITDTRFKCIRKKEKLSTFSSPNNSLIKIECIYTNRS